MPSESEETRSTGRKVKASHALTRHSHDRASRCSVTVTVLNTYFKVTVYGCRIMAPFRKKFALGQPELEAVLSFVCERLPSLERPPRHEYAPVLDALGVFVQRLMADESLYKKRDESREPSAVAAAMSELTKAMYGSSGQTAAGKAGIAHDLHPHDAQPRAEGPPPPPGLEAFDASSPPRVFSRVLSSERLALRPMLPAPIASRSMPFEVIQSTLQRHKDSTSALLADSDAFGGLGRAHSRENVGPLSPSASTQKVIVVPSPSQTWTREEYVPHMLPSRRGSALFAAEDELADDGKGAQTIIESCESYLSLLREQQQRLREQRDQQQRQLQQQPPVAGWYAIKSPAFGTNLQRARSWAEPSEMDWWRTQ